MPLRPIQRHGRPLSLPELYFNASGRLSRSAFIWAAAGLAAAVLPARRGSRRDQLRSAAWIAGAPVATALGCVTSKRLHDRGWSGWWSGPLLLACACARRRGRLGRAARGVLALAAIGLSLVPGEPDFNRFGPRP